MNEIPLRKALCEINHQLAIFAVGFMFHGRVSSVSHIIGNLKTLCHSQILHWSCNVQSSNQMHVLLCHVCWRTHPKQLAISPICPANPYFKTVAKRWISFLFTNPQSRVHVTSTLPPPQFATLSPSTAKTMRMAWLFSADELNLTYVP